MGREWSTPARRCFVKSPTTEGGLLLEGEREREGGREGERERERERKKVREREGGGGERETNCVTSVGEIINVTPIKVKGAVLHRV